MKEKVKKKLLVVHSYIDRFFYFLVAELLLPILAVILGITSWTYPVFSIWTDIIDKEFNPIKSFGYIVVGVILLYISLALYKVKKKLK